MRYRNRRSAADLNPGEILTWREIVTFVLHFVDVDKRRFFGFSAVLMVVYFNYLLPPYILAKTVDFFTHYIPGADLTYFYSLIVILGASQIISSVIRQFSKGALARIGVNARYRTKVWGFDKLVELSLEWHQKENTGNKIQRILTGSKAVENMLRMFSNTLLVTLVTFIGTAVTTSSSNSFYIFFYVFYFFVMAGIEIFFNTKINYLLDEFNRQQEIASGALVESTSNMLAIKALGAKDTLSKKLVEREGAAKDVTYKKIHLRNLKWITFNVATAVLGSIFLLVTAQEVMAGVITAGTIIMYWSYFFNFTQRVTDAVESFDDMLEIKADISRMAPIFKATNFIRSGSEKFPARWNKIMLKKIAFNYAENAPAINDLSLTLSRGEKVGIAGHSGSGKSTLIKLLLGLYEIQSGTITIGKENLYDISHDELTQNISIVLQETELFNLSLKENITMMRDVDLSIIEKALYIANLDSVVEKLPQGIDTLIGEKGYSLSGGERQRVGIARAICKNAQVLLLDEATSALDSQNEKIIMERLYTEITKDKTVIIIAHRISTLRGTDTIYVFEKGKIIEQGAFNELVKKAGSVFASMYSIQSAQQSE